MLRRACYGFLTSPEFVSLVIWIAFLIAGAPHALDSVVAAGISLVWIAGGMRVLMR